MFFSIPVKPCEVTNLIFAHICWMEAISGKATMEVQSVDRPYASPAWE